MVRKSKRIIKKKVTIQNEDDNITAKTKTTTTRKLKKQKDKHNKEEQDIDQEADVVPSTATSSFTVTRVKKEEEEEQQPEESSTIAGSNNSSTVPTPSIPKYKICDKVYARDIDGLLYEAIIRRKIYGPHTHKQINVIQDVKIDEQKLLLSKSIEKRKEYIEKQIQDVATTNNNEQWHYFVHFSGWKVRWDRWVCETDVLPIDDSTKQLADTLFHQHKLLQIKFKKYPSSYGKKATMDGMAFSKAWKDKIQEIIDEYHQQQQMIRNNNNNNNDDESNNNIRQSPRNKKKRQQHQQDVEDSSSPPSPAAKKRSNSSTTPSTATTTTTTTINCKNPWTKAIIEKESKLQKLDLCTSSNTMQQRNYKLNMMQQQQQQQFQQELSTFMITLPFGLKKVLVEEWEIISQCHMVPSTLPASVTIRQALDMYLESKGISRTNDEKATTKQNTETNTTKDEKKTQQFKKEKIEEDDKDSESIRKQEQLQSLHEEWIEMTNGIALLFDQALPFRLLYYQEMGQHWAIEADVDVEDDEKEKENTNASSLPSTTTSMDVPTPTSSAAAEPAIADTSTTATTTTTKDEDDNNNSNNPNLLDDDKDKSNENMKRTKGLGLKRKSELYGCEHLLRLCLKLPELLAEHRIKEQQEKLKEQNLKQEQRKKNKEKDKQENNNDGDDSDDSDDSDDESTADLTGITNQQLRTIVAKVNDLIRFLHKHQSKLFAQSYRQSTISEIRYQRKWNTRLERQKMARGRKRKQQQEEEQQQQQEQQKLLQQQEAKNKRKKLQKSSSSSSSNKKLSFKSPTKKRKTKR